MNSTGAAAAPPVAEVTHSKGRLQRFLPQAEQFLGVVSRRMPGKELARVTGVPLPNVLDQVAIERRDADAQHSPRRLGLPQQVQGSGVGWVPLAQSVEASRLQECDL